MTQIYSAHQWIEENSKYFLPPICNKCMFSDQLKVFFVGGPNQRADYHLELGEEISSIFNIQKCDMLLKVIDNGVPRDITIREGEAFLLPARIEHSPQRFANTIGCVVERERSASELDAMRFFVENSTETLYERWFHLEDIEKDMPPLIAAYRSSQQARTGQPGEDSCIRSAPYVPKHTQLEMPFALDKFINDNIEAIRKNAGRLALFDVHRYQTQIYLHSQGKHRLSVDHGEQMIWQLRGTTELIIDDERIRIVADQWTIVKNQGQKLIQLNIDDPDAICLTLRQQTPPTTEE